MLIFTDLIVFSGIILYGKLKCAADHNNDFELTITQQYSIM